MVLAKSHFQRGTKLYCDAQFIMDRMTDTCENITFLQLCWRAVTNIYRPQRSWGKVIFSPGCVILFTGGVKGPRGCMVPGGGAWSRVEVHGPGGCLVLGGPSGGPPPRDGYCCGRYASYWNAFLFLAKFKRLFLSTAWDKRLVWMRCILCLILVGIKRKWMTLRYTRAQ